MIKFFNYYLDPWYYEEIVYICIVDIDKSFKLRKNSPNCHLAGKRAMFT